MEHFYCEKQSATLSIPSCVAMYQAAKKDGKGYFGSRVKCKGCDVGACHAGDVSSAKKTNPLYKASHCPRCHNKHATRMVKGLCISCLNRQYEMEKGKNAKGAAPVKLRELHAFFVNFYAEELGACKKWVQKTTSRIEAIFHILRNQPSTVSFGWSSPRPPMRQLSLFG